MAAPLTFKEYLKSKEALLEAIKKTPKQTKEYTVTRYCNFVVGESKDDRQTINLKPHVIMTIDWLYETVDNPIPLSISFNGIKGNTMLEDLCPVWNPQKIQKWLIRNTEEKPHI